MASPISARLLVNPAGGRGRAARQLPLLRELTERAGIPIEVSSSAEDLTLRARHAVDEGVERLLVAGGDGSAHYAVQALAGSDSALAVLPLGSGNDLAGTFDMPSELPEAFERALTAPTRSIDLARVGDRLYAGVAGVGFDSVANETANQVKRLKGQAIYLYAVIHTLATFKPPKLTIDHAGGRFEGRAMLVVLANTPRFGGGMRVAPDARPDDGLLDLVIVKAVPRRTFLTIFPKVYRGGHIGHPAVLTARTPWARVRLDRPMTVYGDGEPLLPVPEEGLRFEVVPRRLLVVG